MCEREGASICAIALIVKSEITLVHKSRQVFEDIHIEIFEFILSIQGTSAECLLAQFIRQVPEAAAAAVSQIQVLVETWE